MLKYISNRKVGSKNIMQKEYCKRGHKLSGDGVRIRIRKRYGKTLEEKKCKKCDCIYSLIQKGKTRYSLTPEKILEIIETRTGRCEICGRYDKNQLSIDHCHKTGKFRGLLCNMCNVGLGFARDDIAILQNMIIYLKKHDEL